jgi:hypothetical protein
LPIIEEVNNPMSDGDDLSQGQWETVSEEQEQPEEEVKKEPEAAPK